MQNPIIINTTPTEAAADHITLSATWRNTATKVVPESQKYRSVAVPEEYISTQEVKEVPSKYRGIIIDALITIGGERLADFCQNSNMMATTVSAELFRTDALLAWNADRKALQQRLTADELKAWAPTSATVKAAHAAYSEEQANAIAALLVKLASPNHGLTPVQAGNFLARVWKSADADSITGLRVQLRLQSIADSSAAAADALSAILG